MIIFVFPCLWKSMFQFLEKICIIKFYTTVRNGAFKLIYVWIFNRYQFPVESQILGVEMESMPDLLLISQTCQIHKLCLTSTTSGVIQDRSLSLLVKYTQASLLHHFVIGKGRSLILLSGYIWLWIAIMWLIKLFFWEVTMCLFFRFIRLIEQHNKLLRNYTQNIDTLEQVAGIKDVIQCHGNYIFSVVFICICYELVKCI